MNISEKFNVLTKKIYANLSRVSGETFLVAENDKVSPKKIAVLIIYIPETAIS